MSFIGLQRQQSWARMCFKEQRKERQQSRDREGKEREKRRKREEKERGKIE